MTYTVKEMCLTAEWANIGRAAVCIRFAGCNLWSGGEADCAAVICQFCDADFVGGSRYGRAEELADAAASPWPTAPHRMAVLTDGGPSLQVDAALNAQQGGFYVTVETNGTQQLPARLDWLCVSPKAGAPHRLSGSSSFTATHRWLSSMDGPARAENMHRAGAYCLAHPGLAIQAHRTWGSP